MHGVCRVLARLENSGIRLKGIYKVLLYLVMMCILIIKVSVCVIQYICYLAAPAAISILQACTSVKVNTLVFVFLVAGVSGM